MLLKNGTVVNFGKTETILNEYIYGTTNEQLIIKDIYKEDENYFQDFFMCDEDFKHKEEFKYDEEIFIKIKLKTNNSIRSLELAMRLLDSYKRAVFTIHHNISEIESCSDTKDFLISIPKNFLTPNIYSWVICINHPGYRSYDLQEDIISFKILETGSPFARYDGLEYGNVFAKYLIKKL
jgi:lipopolysaccharide transport system ATP-binding protein